tara:strand:+ start:3394 stop:3642 length:249 start_codon:yes stop_codon:yes gene_type:complete
MKSKQIQIGDLVKMKETSHYPGETENKNITGVVIDVVMEGVSKKYDQRGVEDHWLKIVFLDGTKATLFHDELEILAKTKGNK